MMKRCAVGRIGCGSVSPTAKAWTTSWWTRLQRSGKRPSALGRFPDRCKRVHQDVVQAFAVGETLPQPIRPTAQRFIIKRFDFAFRRVYRVDCALQGFDETVVW